MFVKKKISNPLLIGFIALVLMLLLSLFLIEGSFKEGKGARNLEASYHVLLTINALNESPVNNHWFLPTVSLSKLGDKNIPWGATVPTKTGDYIYTSFTPPGFWAPYLIFKCFNIKPSITHLAEFNFLLGAITSVVLFVLLWNILNFINYTPWVAVGGALIGSTIGIFSREALQSHGLIYWSHCLNQVFLIINLYFVFKYITTNPLSGKRNQYAWIILILAFFCAFTEWTGYIFNIGLAALFFIGISNGVGLSRSLALRILLATILAGVFTIVYYGLAVGFQPAIQAFIQRFQSRSANTGTLINLMQGYSLSFGLFLIVLMIMLVVFFFTNNKKKMPDETSYLVFIFIAASIPLLENLLMLQHASQFTFDRLKFIFPAAFIFAFAFCRQNVQQRILLSVLIILSCIQGYNSYKNDLRIYAGWHQINASNHQLALKIANKVNLDCTVFASNLHVRGYSNLLFHRGIYEIVPPESTMAFVNNHRGCANVYLKGINIFPDLPKYVSATIYYPNNTTETIKSD